MQTVDRKHTAFLFSTMAGLLAQHVNLAVKGQQRGGATIATIMADACEIDPDNIPDDVDAAVSEFLQYATSERRVSPDGFNEIGEFVDRPLWATPLSFAGDGEFDDDDLEGEAEPFDTGIAYDDPSDGEAD